MPVKTVQILVSAMTDRANAQIRATGAIIDELRRKSPVEMQVRLDKAQALAESRIFAGELSRTIREATKVQVTAGDQGVFKLLGGAFGGGGGRSAAGGAGGIVQGFGQLPPVVQGGLGVTALGVLPLIAQAAAGMITFGFGSALTGLGVYAEKGVRSVQVQFAGLQADVTRTFNNLSPAFGQALTTILSAARTFVPQLIRDFKPALDAIAGPLKSLGVMFAGSLASPAVARSIQTLGQAFGKMLSAITPQIPGDINAIANGFTAIFRSATSPQALKAESGFVFFLAHAAAGALQVIGALSNVAGWIEKNWKWDQWFLVPEVAVTATFIRNLGNLRQWIYDDFILKIGQFFKNLGPTLKTLGSAAMQLFWDGLKSLSGGILGWLHSFWDGVLNLGKRLLGIGSPSKAFYEMGRQTMAGFALGIKDHAHLAQQAVTGAVGALTGGRNVASWISAAMRITGVPSSWGPLLERLVSFESGGNPLARNLTPAGAAAGYPEGIAQVTIGTFAGSHLPGLNNIWNPVDNLVAGIRHILSAWGSIFNIPGLGTPGPYQGYDAGGWLMPGATLALNRTGSPEMVTPGRKLDELIAAVRENTSVLGSLLASIDGNTAAAPAVTGAALGAALGMGSRAAVYSSLYP